jgi:hypothetical protein
MSTTKEQCLYSRTIRCCVAVCGKMCCEESYQIFEDVDLQNSF